MSREQEVGDLKLIVRALHRDVSELDTRLQVLEQEIRRLHQILESAPDLLVVPAEGKRAQLPA